MVLLGWYWWVLSGWLLYCAVENACFFKKPPRLDQSRSKWPKISILIPARNEEQRIEPCLKALVQMDYPNFEVLVLDDRSTDGTFNLVQRYAKSNRRLKVFRGKTLPPGWLGKPWACYQLAQKAKGEWLFFIDADTWHLPEALKRTLQMAEETQADVLSLLTRQVTQSPMEALVIPVMAFHLLSYFPARWSFNPKSRWSRFAGVSGQFIFIKRKVHQAFGGHERVQNEIVEDLNFGKKLVEDGYRVRLGDGSDFSLCRMYTNGREVWEGFSKNFFPAVHFSMFYFWNCIGVLLINGVLPFWVLSTGRGTSLFLPALVLCSTLWVTRGYQAIRYGMSKGSVPFHAVGCLLFALIGFNSLRWFLFGKGHWKGRRLTASTN